jgi:hypothetical protein
MRKSRNISFLRNPYRYMRKYTAGRDDTDKGLARLPKLTHLDCLWNENFTDKGLAHLPNLSHLVCGYNENFTDKGLAHLPNLTYLNRGYNENFTDESINKIRTVEKRCVFYE